MAQMARSSDTRTIADRQWTAERCAAGATVAEIAKAAHVSVPTARIWIKRHGLAVQSQSTKRNDLSRLYKSLGSVAEVARELSVSPETARQRLIQAGVELKRQGRQEGAHVVDVDVHALQRRRAGGQSLRSIAAEVGIDWRTVKKLLGELDALGTGKRPVQKR
jgi:orotate phosphoribosyltransferase-like protein